MRKMRAAKAVKKCMMLSVETGFLKIGLGLWM